MTFTAPVFWHSSPNGPRAHQLPDARSDVKGRTVLRRLRSGYAAISSSPLKSDAAPAAQPMLQTAEVVEAPAEAAPAEAAPIEEEIVVPDVPSAPASELPTPAPCYTSDEPPPYPPPSAQSNHSLPPALPGYRPIPGPINEPIRDIQQPVTEPRKRYRDALRKRIALTRRMFSGDKDVLSKLDADSDTDSMCGDTASARGVVMYREGNRWIGASTLPENEKKVQTRSRSLRGWLKKVWNRSMDFLEEHPYLFVLAVFAIIVVVLCLLI